MGSCQKQSVTVSELNQRLNETVSVLASLCNWIQEHEELCQFHNPRTKTNRNTSLDKRKLPGEVLQFLATEKSRQVKLANSRGKITRGNQLSYYNDKISRVGQSFACIWCTDEFPSKEALAYHKASAHYQDDPDGNDIAEFREEESDEDDELECWNQEDSLYFESSVNEPEVNNFTLVPVGIDLETDSLESKSSSYCIGGSNENRLIVDHALDSVGDAEAQSSIQILSTYSLNKSHCPAPDLHPKVQNLDTPKLDPKPITRNTMPSPNIPKKSTRIASRNTLSPQGIRNTNSEVLQQQQQQQNPTIVKVQLKKFLPKWECKYCGKLFRHQSGRCRHQKLSHGEPRFYCHTCHRQFRRKEQIGTHSCDNTIRRK